MRIVDMPKRAPAPAAPGRGTDPGKEGPRRYRDRQQEMLHCVTTSDLLFRPATAKDVGGILNIQKPGAILGLGHIFPQDEHPFPRDVVEERWQTEMADEATAIYVAIDASGHITGFAARRDDVLLHFGTAKESWGSGLAKQLHDALLTTFPASVRRIRLRVFEENHRARRFYEKLDWSPTGETSRTQFPPFPLLLEYALCL